MEGKGSTVGPRGTSFDVPRRSQRQWSCHCGSPRKRVAQEDRCRTKIVHMYNTALCVFSRSGCRPDTSGRVLWTAEATPRFEKSFEQSGFMAETRHSYLRPPLDGHMLAFLSFAVARVGLVDLVCNIGTVDIFCARSMYACG